MIVSESRVICFGRVAFSQGNEGLFLRVIGRKSPLGRSRSYSNSHYGTRERFQRMEEPEKASDAVNEDSEESSVARRKEEDNKVNAVSSPDPMCNGCQSAGNGDGTATMVVASQAGSGKKKHRRGSRKNKIRKPRYKWKPYHKLTWEEKRKVEERDSIRAARRREEISKRGRPIAPYNTTQFLMDEHDKIEPDLHTPHEFNRLPSEELSDCQEDCNGSFSSEDEAYFDQDFTEVYETAHVENLNSMSKAELIRNYLDLEKRVENLEHTARRTSLDSSIGNENIDMRLLDTDYVSSPQCVEILQDETPSAENGICSSTTDGIVNS